MFRCRAALVPLLLAWGGCAAVSPPAHWVDSSFGKIGYQTMCDMVAAAIESEGYGAPRIDMVEGVIESPWAYGTSMRKVRGPSRRKVWVEINRDAGPALHVRLRVAEEVIQKGGLLATHVRDSDDWEAYEDNKADAEQLMEMLRILLADPEPAAAVQQRLGRRPGER